MTIQFRSDAEDEVERARAPKIAGTGPPPSGPDAYGVSHTATAVAAALFKVERWGEIAFGFDEEFLIDAVLPKQGVGLAYGASQTLKSFVAMHMGLCVALDQPWAGRRTERAPVVYLAAEGAVGLRKRKAGYVKAGRAPPSDVEFALIPAAPNLGVSKEDYNRLVATIEAAEIKPGLIIIDTVAKVIGGADENGAGMAQFLVNAEALAQHFGCFVMAVRHTGWNDEAKDRPRGWSGLPAALDVQILCQRKEGEMSATLTLQKLKDEASGLRLNVQMPGGLNTYRRYNRRS
jgi:RecA-family ATPase